MFASLLCAVAMQGTRSWEGEVMYHIFVRSYRDSNHDGIGDFKGIEEGIPTIKKLGATVLLLSPIYKSRLYHNYFADDFFQPDPEFGTIDQFKHLVSAAHKAKMKVLLDMEPQYVTDQHPWYQRALKGEKGLLWNATVDDPALPSIWYDKCRAHYSQVELGNAEVRTTIQGMFQFWSGTGLDGYRIDHMMDDLDNAKRTVNLFRDFWNPLETAIKQQFPGTYFLAEQSDWGSAKQVADIFAQTPTDAAFSFYVNYAISKYEKGEIGKMLESYAKATPPNHDLVTFLENHDMPRFASMVSDIGKQKLAAALLLTSKGLPSIYYGEEIGMRGKKGNWNSDGNDIPMRLAYRWGRDLSDPRTPLWYKDTGPWWSRDYSSDNDGNSVDEQEAKPDSLLNWYRKLIQIRRSSKALSVGTQTLVPSDNDKVLGFERKVEGESVRILANLSGTPVEIAGTVGIARRDLISGQTISPGKPVTLGAWAVMVLPQMAK